MLTQEEKETLNAALSEDSELESSRLAIEDVILFGMRISPGAFVKLFTKHRGEVSGALISANSCWVYIAINAQADLAVFATDSIIEFHVGARWVKAIGREP